ncbi:TetR/AcrR family transcriptional regulator [Nocardia sp. NBC_00416]|uniref:TetR/AcrR family transcriptional regulator n=1 Tax=Nocardia sp. NBC_00416 TaxID=2975991 RepID=UPI002E23BBCE
MANQFSSVWTREPRRPRTSGLRRDQIVRAAVAILDKEGLDALSMRRLGAELDAGATSLYWHVANKTELLELALDEIWGLVDDLALDRTDSLRQLLTTFAYNLRAALLDHPWSATLIGRVPAIGPQAFRLSERLRRAFADAGFQGLDIYLASGTITSFVLGQVIPVIAMENSHGGRVDRDSVLRTLDKAAADYPEMRADYRSLMPEDPGSGHAMGFDFGLLCVLDGLEARRRAQQTAPPQPATGESATPPGTGR